MRLRNVKNAKEILNQSPFYLSSLKDCKENWQKIFSKNAPIHLEIGCGKGKFLIEMAQKYPDICFVGMEYQESVLVRAIQKIDTPLPNIRFILANASTIQDIFDHEIDVLYLNFSDPWPKKRHAKRRLTSSYYLEKYETIFKNEKTILQKTDNLTFFGYSLEELSKQGYTLEKISFDLENEKDNNYAFTEYEEKFMKLGYPINFVKAIKK